MSASVTSAPTILAHLSDPHVRAGPGDGGASAALAAAVAAVLGLEPEPDAVIVTGDIADTAAAGEYDRAQELLAPLPMPVHVLPGNHDDRDALRERFGPAGAGGPGGPLRYAVACGRFRLVLCDSTVPGEDGGQADADSCAWLERRLDEEPETPTIVAMHHPPLLTGVPDLDAIGVPEADRAALASILGRAPQVRLVVGGHVHRAVFSTLGGCGVVACPSTHLLARLEIGKGMLELVPEAPAFAVHVALGDELVSHVQPVTTAA